MTTTAAADADERVQITPEELGKSEDISKWYTERITIPPGAQTLLEQYSGFAPDEIIPHVRDLVSAHHGEHQHPCHSIIRSHSFSLTRINDSGNAPSERGHTHASDT